MRLIIIAFLIYIFYRLLKGGKSEHKKYDSMGGESKDIGEMVQDPECKTYIPIDQAYQRRIKGKRYFFCSKECADIFEKKLKEEQK